MTWLVMCPDGVSRHYAYRNEGDAECDAQTCDERCAALYGAAAQDNDCPGGEHKVRHVPLGIGE